MIENLPATIDLAVLAPARQAEDDALRSDDPWVRADALAEVWLRSPKFTPGTRDQYERVYQSWRVWCTATGVPPLEARRRDVEAYAAALEKVGNPAAQKPRPLSRRSIVRHLAALSSYYRRAAAEEVTTRPNPVPIGDLPKVSRESPQPYMSAEDLRALIAAADADGARSSALVALLAMACLRVSEAISANVEDLTVGQRGVRFLRVHRKGGKVQQVPLPPPVWERVERVVAGRRQGPLLATSAGRRWDRKAAWETMRRLGRKAGIAAPIGPHTLRHAYITRGHELQIPVAALQDAAGHASVNTTRGYDRSRFDPDRHPSFLIAADLTR